MSVAPRWKRRADEIAEAIGDELSVNGTVSIGNDVNLSVATITALANAITDVLNPTDIAAAMYALTMPVSVVSTSTTPVHVQVRNIAGGFTAMGSDISTSMKLTAQPVSIADTVNVKTDTGDSVAISGTVNLNVGSSTVPISNPNNITVPVVNSNSVTVPVSLGSVTVPVKATAAGIPQNANGISLYLPVDANHGLTIPVGGGVTSIPVTVGSATVPVRVVTNTSQGASTFGTGVVVPVSGGIASVPVSNSTGVTVQISGGTSSVPVANTNSVVVPVRTVTGTTNAADGTGAAVVVPVTASGTVLDVKITEVADLAKTSFHEAMETALEDADVVDVNISTVAAAAKTQFHEATETALNDATGINTVDQNGLYYGYVYEPSSLYNRVFVDGTIHNVGSITLSGTGDYLNRGTHSYDECVKLMGLRVFTRESNYATYTATQWFTIDNKAVNATDPRIGYVFSASNSSGINVWTIQDSTGNQITGQAILWADAWQYFSLANKTKFRGATVHHEHGTQDWLVTALAI
jgi:hypothetical protein